MGEPRTCRKCGVPIPESRGPKAEDCGLPKCKSKAYREQKKAEAAATAVALATAQATSKESVPESRTAQSEPDIAQVQSPAISAPSCGSAPTTASVQEVRLQPGQHSIVLVCGCGARTSLQISHTEAASESAQVANPAGPMPGEEVALPVANPAQQPVAPKADQQGSAVANPVSPVAAEQSPTLSETPVANPVAVVATESTQPPPSPPVAPVNSDRSKPEQSTQPIWNDDLPDPIPFTVYEMYAYRGARYDEPILIDEALTKLGKLHPDCHVTFTINPERGFKLCAPTGFHRILWGIAHQLKRCQLPKKLIVYGRRGQSKDQVMSHNVDIKMIERLLGKNWQWMLGA